MASQLWMASQASFGWRAKRADDRRRWTGRTPYDVGTSSYGGGASYGRRSRGYGSIAQNVVQDIGSGSNGIGADGTVALGKISVTASVSVSYRLQPQ